MYNNLVSLWMKAMSELKEKATSAIDTRSLADRYFEKIDLSLPFPASEKEIKVRDVCMDWRANLYYSLI